MQCSVCEGENPKYKCPTCRNPYCSVLCCKKHKENCVPLDIIPVEEENTSKLSSYNYPTEDTVSVDKLKMLENSEGLKECLRNPHLREILKNLDKCNSPADMIENFMQEPIFTEFVDECLKVVSPNTDDGR